jgi:FkbM family methyltransferase
MSQKYHLKKKGLKIVIDHLKCELFKVLTKNSARYIIPSGDSVSVQLQVLGFHDEGLTSIIKGFAVEGYSDFLIDIGANIGFITCQTGAYFKHVVCIEPNPVCVLVLKANTGIYLDKSKLEIVGCGLGSRSGEVEFWIPKNNLGGAFVKDLDNKYTDEVIAKKDGYKTVEKTNYTITKVNVVEAEDKLREIFEEIRIKNLRKGVVKIDVEGLEQVVIDGIARALPEDLSIKIIFENWNHNFNFDRLIKSFGKRFRMIEKIEVEGPYRHTWPRLIKAMLLTCCSQTIVVKELSKCSRTVGDIIVTVN